MSVIVTCVTLFLYLSGLTEAFFCYTCSYDKLWNTDKDWNIKECMDKPDKVALPYPCNDTGFCIFQETFSLELKEVTSYYRSCSKTSLGNKCTKDSTRLICVGSCKGNFCNRNDTGQQYAKFFGNSSAQLTSNFTLDMSLCVYVMLLTILKSL